MPKTKNHAKIIRNENDIATTPSRSLIDTDPCFHCQKPVSECKGTCTVKQRLKNGGFIKNGK